jgi:hypothetical protein
MLAWCTHQDTAPIPHRKARTCSRADNLSGFFEAWSGWGPIPPREPDEGFAPGQFCWSKPRKVIAGVEASEQGSDIRFSSSSTKRFYCARGRMENLIKDMKLYTRFDRISCHRWEANQFRLLLHMGLTGSCTNSGAPRQNAQSGAQQPSRPSAALSSRSLCASKSSRPASRWRCPQPIRTFKP